MPAHQNRVAFRLWYNLDLRYGRGCLQSKSGRWNDPIGYSDPALAQLSLIGSATSFTRAVLVRTNTRDVVYQRLANRWSWCT